MAIPAFLTFSAAPEKNYSENTGSYHRVKLLISPSGSYELRVNIFDCVEEEMSTFKITHINCWKKKPCLHERYTRDLFWWN